MSTLLKGLLSKQLNKQEKTHKQARKVYDTLIKRLKERKRFGLLSCTFEISPRVSMTFDRDYTLQYCVKHLSKHYTVVVKDYTIVITWKESHQKERVKLYNTVSKQYDIIMKRIVKMDGMSIKNITYTVPVVFGVDRETLIQKLFDRINADGFSIARLRDQLIVSWDKALIDYTKKKPVVDTEPYGIRLANRSKLMTQHQSLFDRVAETLHGNRS